MTGGSVSASGSEEQLIVCGWDEVFLWRLRHPSDTSPAKTWSWRASARSDLPQEFRGRFETTDECKPFEQARKLLITSSGGGVALVDRLQDKVRTYAFAPRQMFGSAR